MEIAIGSENPVKVAAVKEAFRSLWKNKTLSFRSLTVKSGVSRQPMSDRESLRGARTRARSALRKTGADFGVGIEGGLQKIGAKWFDCGWVVVAKRNGPEGTGSTLRMEISKKMIRLIKKGMELGTVNDLLFRRKNSKQAEGHFGLMTDRVLTRKDAYKDAVVSALVRFLKPKIFSR